MIPAPTYTQTLLRMYLQLPDTPHRARPADRRLAIELQSRQVPLDIVESAFLLTTVRRLCRSRALPPLAPIRSLAYFIPAIDEVLQQPLASGYVEYLRAKTRTVLNPQPTARSTSK